jgi:hypothetical protein
VIAMADWILQIFVRAALRPLTEHFLAIYQLDKQDNG